ncbi:dCTP deaminase domain-containing protein [Nostoc linckia]|uniref:dCTP deaminase domain-containing protein n=1 Tax=Nostoc linckia TaxID=92942 RepID=UPI000BFFABED|nr:hypothetical protein [Nostoc linckia]
MAFWGGKRLATEGAEKEIVSNFDPEQVDCNAYELTLGSEAYVSPGMAADLNSHQKIALKEPTEKKFDGKIVRCGGGIVTVPSGQFAFLLTEETVKIPRDAMGFISLKFGMKAKGLINVSGFHVDPGYNGNLVFSVFNAGPSPIQMARGESLFLLWVADLSGDDDDEFIKKDIGQLEISSNLISKISNKNHSLQALSEKIDDLAGKVEKIKTGAIILSTAAAIALAFLALPFFNSEGDHADPGSRNSGIGTINIVDPSGGTSDTSEPVASSVNLREDARDEAANPSSTSEDGAGARR